MINLKQKAMLFSSAALLISNTAFATSHFQDPDGASWGGWSIGDADTSFVHWDVIDAIPDSTPDGGNEGVSSAILNPNNAGAFITGGGLGGNIYSFSDTPDFTVVLAPNYTTASTDPVTVALQVKILGTDLDAGSVKLDGVAWDSTATLFSGDAGGPFGGQDREYLYVWNDVTASAAYQLDFLAQGSSMSLDELSVNIGVSAVPLPAAAWLFLTALSGMAVTSRRKGHIA